MYAYVMPYDASRFKVPLRIQIIDNHLISESRRRSRQVLTNYYEVPVIITRPSITSVWDQLHIHDILNHGGALKNARMSKFIIPSSLITVHTGHILWVCIIINTDHSLASLPISSAIIHIGLNKQREERYIILLQN